MNPLADISARCGKYVVELLDGTLFNDHLVSGSPQDYLTTPKITDEGVLEGIRALHKKELSQHYEKRIYDTVIHDLRRECLEMGDFLCRRRGGKILGFIAWTIVDGSPAIHNYLSSRLSIVHCIDEQRKVALQQNGKRYTWYPENIRSEETPLTSAAYISSICVDSRLKGSGLGYELVRSALEVLRSKGLTHAYASTVIGSGSPELFEKHGFKPLYERTPCYADGAGMKFLVHRLRESGSGNR